MGHHTITEIAEERYQFNGRSKMISVGLLVVGLVLMGIGYMSGGSSDSHGEAVAATEHTEQTAGHAEEAHATEDHATDAEHTEEGGHGHEAKGMVERLWANLLMNSYYFFLFGVGALFFMAVNYVANAGWATLLKRIMEAMSSYVAVGFVLLILVVFLGQDYFYHWVEYFSHGYTPADKGYDAILESKSWLLNKGMLFGLPLFVIAVWLFVRTKYRTNSLKEDAEGGLAYFRNSTRWSAFFIFFFAFSFSAMSWLIIMSIDAHWYSTMFSVYNFAVTFVTGLTVIMMFLLYLKSKGYMEVVSDEVVHDLGKFMFAFCIFWGYIFLGQWLLIWYAHLPEERVYFTARLDDNYKALFFANIFMCFLLPFLVLMMRNAKRNPIVLIVAGILILVGHWVDMYLMVMPGLLGDSAGIGMLEIGTTMAFAGIFIYVVLYSLSKANLYPKNHPYLLESANHDVGP